MGRQVVANMRQPLGQWESESQDRVDHILPNEKYEPIIHNKHHRKANTRVFVNVREIRVHAFQFKACRLSGPFVSSVQIVFINRKLEENAIDNIFLATYTS
jgi:hypothetical protein